MKTLQTFGPGGCCPCPDMDGCNCGGGCSLQCRAKAGTAELCGFAEFANPSNPPKMYRRKVVEGTMYAGKFGSSDCGSEDVLFEEYIDAADDFPNWARISFRIDGLQFWPLDWQVSASYQYPMGDPYNVCPNPLCNPSGDVYGYIFLCKANGPGDENEVGSRLWSRNGFFANQSGTIGASHEANLEEGAWYMVVAWILHPVTNFLVSSEYYWFKANSPLEVTRDEWDLEQTHNASTCVISEVDESARYRATFEAYPLTTGGTPVPGEPASLDYDPNLVDFANETATTRETVGLETCTETVAGEEWQQFEGTVTETLSIEDTEDDAIARAAPEGELVAVESCLLNPAFVTLRGPGEFIFAYRRVQVRAQLVDPDPLTSYDVTIRFFRRVVGTSNSWVFFASQELTVVTDSSPATAEFTEWVDVPNEAGWETRAQSCVVALA